MRHRKSERQAKATQIHVILGNRGNMAMVGLMDDGSVAQSTMVERGKDGAPDRVAWVRVCEAEVWEVEPEAEA